MPIFKWFLGAIALIVAAVVALAAHTWYLKPIKIGWFYEISMLKSVIDNPELLSRLRILEPMGIDGHNDDLTDVSVAAQKKSDQKTIDNLNTLRRYDRDDLEGQTALSYDVLEWFLQNQADGAEFSFHNYPVNQLFGVQNNLPAFMATIHAVTDEDSAEDYIERLDQFDTKFEQTIEGLQYRRDRDIYPPRFTIDKVLAEMRGFVDTPVEENILYTSFTRKLTEAKIEDKGDLADEAREVIQDVVYPAYGALIAWFEELQPQVTTNHGAWALPNGKAFYAWRIRNQTTTDLSADEIHRIGLSEVDRIQTEMDTILRAEGMTQGSVGERVNQLSKRDDQIFEDSDAGREAILQRYRDLITDIDAKLDPLFDVRPKASVNVERVPVFREAGSAGAYYSPPALDGSRPGTFYANLRSVEEIAKFGMKTLAYHEAVPGHHFQIAIAQEIEGVPTFRKILPFTAFVEGWALYSERVAKEIGMYEGDPLGDLGRLQAELFRAVRLVVDTGIHSKRWSRERAIDYMASNTGMPQTDVVAEIERYFVIPGQALAYKLGQLRMLALRQKAVDALGEGFDIKAFHNLVLTNGAVPLTVLEAQVDTWIANRAEG